MSNTIDIVACKLHISTRVAIGSREVAVYVNVFFLS